MPTAGELRQIVARLGDHAWTVAEHLGDGDQVPKYATGADLSQVPLAAQVAPRDMTQVLATPWRVRCCGPGGGS